jgi:hypothetical protein
VTFRYQPLISGIQSCHVVGSFNDWNQTSHPMNDDDGDGTWEATVELAPGEYRYKFLVDGNTWLEDPNAQDSADDGYGGSNSVIRVGPDTRTGAAQPRHVPFRRGIAGRHVQQLGDRQDAAVRRGWRRRLGDDAPPAGGRVPLQVRRGRQLDHG